MSLLLQKLFSAKVEASGSRTHVDGRVNSRRRDLENLWPIAVCRGGVTTVRGAGRKHLEFIWVLKMVQADTPHAVHPSQKTNVNAI